MPGRPRARDLAEFGVRLREAIDRSERFKSRAEFLRFHGLEGATLYRYETGEREPPLALVKAFAESLGVDLRELAGSARDDGETRVEREDGRDGSIGTAALEEYLAELAASDDPASPALSDRARRIYLSGGVDSRAMAMRAVGYARAALAEEAAARPAPPAPRAPTLTDEDRAKGMRSAAEGRAARGGTAPRLGKPKPRGT